MNKCTPFPLGGLPVGKVELKQSPPTHRLPNPVVAIYALGCEDELEFDAALADLKWHFKQECRRLLIMAETYDYPMSRDAALVATVFKYQSVFTDSGQEQWIDIFLMAGGSEGIFGD